MGAPRQSEVVVEGLRNLPIISPFFALQEIQGNVWKYKERSELFVMLVTWWVGDFVQEQTMWGLIICKGRMQIVSHLFRLLP